MFHLLVAYQGWPDNAGPISPGRIYIKKEEHPELFRNGELDATSIARFPALLVTEIGGSGPQLAKVAQITGLVPGGRETTIRYMIDERIPPISNDDLSNYSGELGFSSGVLTHTHWQVCDADLFRVLLHHQQKRAITPNVFSIKDLNRPQGDLAAVMMPFDAAFKPVYTALKKAAAEAGLDCQRADDIWEDRAVVQDIVNLIARARVVICDLSSKNANVFYEIGIAHALGKEVLMITQSEKDVPFDLRHLRYVQYFPNREGLRTLTKAITSRLETILKQEPH